MDSELIYDQSLFYAKEAATSIEIRYTEAFIYAENVVVCG